MPRLAAFAAALLISTAAFADTPQQRFDQLSTQASELYQKKAYSEAAAVLEKMVADPSLMGRNEWPDRFYDLARDYALTGQTDKALSALERATDTGALISAGEVSKQADLASLRDTPRFKAVVDKLTKRAKLWQDDPALATPFKPVLSEEEKAAGLSKIWAEARFNFPFFDRLPDLNWDAAYMAYLEKVRAAKTTEEYYGVLAQFINQLKDGHTRVLVPNELVDRVSAVTGIDTRLIDGKIIVTATADPSVPVQVGDEILTIEGKQARDYADTVIAPRVSGFTPQDRAIWQYGYLLLRGPIDQPAKITVKKANGKIAAASIPRAHNDGPFGILPKLERTASFKMLPDNIAYLEINWFVDDAGLKTLKENFAAASAAKGLIIDLRNNGGGNSDNSEALARVLADKPFLGSSTRTATYRASWRSWNRPQGWHRSAAPTFQPDASLHYDKPVIVLIGGRTYSAAEDFLVAYISSGRGKLVGETSGGSTGNPMLFKLPGGGMAFICTKDDAFGDGRVFEGTGIAPDVTVKPTIADIRAGRDPVLAKAAEMIKAAH